MNTVVVVVAASEDLQEVAVFADQTAKIGLSGVLVVALDATAAVFAQARPHYSAVGAAGEAAEAPRSFSSGRQWRA